MLDDISNMSYWSCPRLQSIYIQNSSAIKLPKINLESLQVLDLEGGDIQDVTEFNLSILPSLSEINLSQNSKLKTMSFPNTVDRILFNGCAF